MHVNPALAGVLAAFLFGGRAAADLRMILVPAILLALVCAMDVALAAWHASHPALVPVRASRAR